MNQHMVGIPKVSESQVANELSALDGTIQRLHTNIERLVERLEPLLRSQSAACPEKMCELEALVPLADIIRIKRIRLEDVVIRINTCLDVIEL